jgi:hypothetical protein
LSTITERVERGIEAGEAGACEAIWTWLGIDGGACGAPAIGRFVRACAHEHVRTGRLCRDHAETSQNGLCLTCWELPGDLSHECPIGITEASE